MPMKSMTTLGNFRHKVTLSSSYTEGENAIDLVLVRTAVKEVWASITPVRGAFYINGIATEESRNSYSHYIVIRYNRDMDISGYAWIYEDRPSGKRWYKVISVQELGERQRFWQITTRLVQKAEDVAEPIIGSVNLPHGARL